MLCVKIQGIFRTMLQKKHVLQREIFLGEMSGVLIREDFENLIYVTRIS